jgi:SprT protein
MTRSLGRCYPDRKLIRIARFVLDESEVVFQEVLCHEAAHVAAFHLHGQTIRPHGREWKTLIQIAGYPPSARYKGPFLSRVPPRARRKRPANSLLESFRAGLLSKVRSLAFSKRKTDDLA